MTEDKAKNLISKGLAVLAMTFLLVALAFIPYWIGHFMFAVSDQEDLVNAGDKWGNGFGLLAFVFGVCCILWGLLNLLGKAIKSKL